MLQSQNIDPENSGLRRFFLVRWVLSVWHWLVPPTQAHQDRQSRTARLLAAWTLVIVCLAAVVTSFAYARPIYHQFKEWRSSRLVKQATQMRESGDIVGAVVTAGKAVVLAPEYEPAIRLNAEMCTIVGQEQALYFWDKLNRMGVIRLEDEMGHVRALQRTHHDKEAALKLENLMKAHPTDTRLMMLGDEVWGKQSNSVQMAVLTEYVAKHPENREIRLRLLKLQLQSGDGSAFDLADGLWAVAEGEDEISLDALRKLGEMDSLDGLARDKLAQRLDAHPLSREPERLTALSIRVAAHPNRKNVLMDEAIERVRGSKPEALVPLARWLVTHREPARVLSLVSEADVKKNEQLLSSYLNALTVLGQNKDLERIIADPSFTFRAATRTFYQAHLALIKGQPRDEVRDKLMLVREDLAASGQGDMLLVLGHYCEERKFYDVAEAAFETAATNTRARIERPALKAWIECSKIRGNSDSLLRATTEANRRWPDDQAFLEEALYAKLLQGIDIELSVSRAEGLLAASPNDSSRKLLAALGYLRLSFIDNSVSLCQNINNVMPTPGQQAVLAAIFHDAGAYRVSNNDETVFRRTLRNLIDQVPLTAQLLPEEAALLRRARGK